MKLEDRKALLMVALIPKDKADEVWASLPVNDGSLYACDWLEMLDREEIIRWAECGALAIHRSLVDSPTFRSLMGGSRPVEIEEAATEALVEAKSA